MKQILSGLRSASFMLALLGASHFAVAQSVDDVAPQPASAALTPGSQQGAVQQAPAQQPAPIASAPAPDSVGGDVAEVQRLISASALTEFRTTYNGSFGASLLFDGKEMTYYVALFQQKSFWRVVKTQNSDRANAIFNDFVRQTVQLSQVEIRKTELESQKIYTERMIALSQTRADQLQADLTIAHTEQAKVAARQQAIMEQSKQLETERQTAQQQLKQVRRRVATLEQENSAGLPPYKH